MFQRFSQRITPFTKPITTSLTTPLTPLRHFTTSQHQIPKRLQGEELKQELEKLKGWKKVKHTNAKHDNQ